MTDDEFPYRVPMWRKEDAHSMAFTRYRNSYIPVKYQEFLKFEFTNTKLFTN